MYPIISLSHYLVFLFILIIFLLPLSLSHLQGGAKVQEAAYIYDELIDKYGSSPVLLNGLAVSKMHLAQWEEAETALKEAITKVKTIACDKTLHCKFVCFFI